MPLSCHVDISYNLFGSAVKLLLKMILLACEITKLLQTAQKKSFSKLCAISNKPPN